MAALSRVLLLTLLIPYRIVQMQMFYNLQIALPIVKQ
jgi:hypothetical protein